MLPNYNQPHLVPQSTEKQLGAAQQERGRQAKAYDMDRKHNQSQMDSLRKHQYRRNADDANKQKRHMANNAAKSSRLVTGTTAYNKEEFTLKDFMDICEGMGGKRRNRRQRGQQRQNAREGALNRASNSVRRATGADRDETEGKRAVHGQKKRPGSNTTSGSGRGITPQGERRKIFVPNKKGLGGKYVKDERAEKKWEIRKKQGEFAVKAARKRKEQEAADERAKKKATADANTAAYKKQQKELKQAAKEKKQRQRGRRELRQNVGKATKFGYNTLRKGKNLAGEMLRDRIKDPGDSGEAGGTSVNRASMVRD